MSVRDFVNGLLRSEIRELEHCDIPTIRPQMSPRHPRLARASTIVPAAILRLECLRPRWVDIHRYLFRECLSQAVQTTVSRYRISGSSSLRDGYDEPEILLSAIRAVCLKGPDAGHKAARTRCDGSLESSTRRGRSSSRIRQLRDRPTAVGLSSKYAKASSERA
jgi:hypothetical protein